jgi:hypothetical protein
MKVYPTLLYDSYYQLYSHAASFQSFAVDRIGLSHLYRLTSLNLLHIMSKKPKYV